MSDMAEFALITRLTAGLGALRQGELGVGDDCAVLDLGGEQHVLVTCDSQVEGVHFTLQTSTAEEIGRKALAVNLSDIAAMGGVPRYALVSLLLPAHISLDVLDAIYGGLRREAQAADIAIVGGNISSAGASKQLVIDISMLGVVQRGWAITRMGARAGDSICVTGTLGDAAAGLYTLFHLDKAYPVDTVEMVRRHHRVPVARIAEGRVLSTFGPTVVTAMLDLSDGLSGDIAHICERSQVGVCIDAEALPLAPEMQAIAALADVDPLTWALHGGEDYQLLFTVMAGREQEVMEEIKRHTGTTVTVIGEVTPAEQGMMVRNPDGRCEVLTAKSWDHLQS